jgi:hypothetical protein
MSLAALRYRQDHSSTEVVVHRASDALPRSFRPSVWVNRKNPLGTRAVAGIQRVLYFSRRMAFFPARFSSLSKASRFGTGISTGLPFLGRVF